MLTGITSLSNDVIGTTTVEVLLRNINQNISFDIIPGGGRSIIGKQSLAKCPHLLDLQKDQLIHRETGYIIPCFHIEKPVVSSVQLIRCPCNMVLAPGAKQEIELMANVVPGNGLVFPSGSSLALQALSVQSSVYPVERGGSVVVENLHKTSNIFIKEGKSICIWLSYNMDATTPLGNVDASSLS